MAMTQAERSRLWRKRHPGVDAQRVAQRRTKMRKRLVEYKGGRCMCCRSNAQERTLCFHHILPALKHFTLSHNNMTKRWDTLTAEADKCILLCTECHDWLHTFTD